jgi:hypothetical protein
METLTSTGTANRVMGNYPIRRHGYNHRYHQHFLFHQEPISASPNNTVSFSAPVSFSNPINFTQSTSKQIMQSKVAVFQSNVRDEDDKIINDRVY